MNLRESHWSVYFLFWLLIIVGGCAMVGAIGFPLFGPLFGSDLSPLKHALVGSQHLGFVGLIWAPGIALVACVIRAHRNKAQR